MKYTKLPTTQEKDKNQVYVTWFYDNVSATCKVKVGDSEPITAKEFWDKYGEDYDESKHGDY